MTHSKRDVLLTLCALAAGGLWAPLVSAATVFGVYAGGGVWSQDIDGDAQSSSVPSVANQLDLQQDLGFGTKRNVQLYAGLEHPIPLLPNIRVEYTEISQNADGQLNRSIEFNGRTFDLASDVLSEVELEQSDVILYYELLDNVISLDLGIGARHVEGFVRVADATGFSSAEFSGVLPIAYAGVRGDLPFTGWWAGGDVRGVSYKGDSLYDLSARIGWESKLGLGLEAGYRIMELELDDFDDVQSADLSIKGPFAGLTFSF